MKVARPCGHSGCRLVRLTSLFSGQVVGEPKPPEPGQLMSTAAISSQ